MNIQSLITVTILFFVLDLFFVMLRASFIYVRLPQLGSLRNQYPQEVDRTLKLIERTHLTATLRLGVVLSHILLGICAALLVHQLLAEPKPIWLLLLIMAGLAILLLFLEFVIEGLVLRNVESWAMRLTGMAKVVDFIFKPISMLLMLGLGKTDALDRSLGSVTDDELLNWVETGQTQGKLEQEERKMIYSIFQLGDTLAREIMVPRIDVVALDMNSSIHEVVEAVSKSGHSRLPVYNEVIDNITGILYAKDLLNVMEYTKASQPFTIAALVRPATFIPEAKKVDELLSEMQAQRVHMAIVIDEYGGMAGLVTLEDIVEEIVGEIRDEFDQSEENQCLMINDDEYLFQARIDLDDFNEVTGTRLTKDVADTLGGWLYGEIGRVPAGGEKIMVDGWQLTVENISGRRIRQVRAVKLDKQLQDETLEVGEDD